MADITKIPKDELIADLVDSIEDIAVCDFALDHEITRYSSGTVWLRLKANEHFVEVITAELKRRKMEEINSGRSLIGPLLDMFLHNN